MEKKVSVKLNVRKDNDTKMFKSVTAQKYSNPESKLQSAVAAASCRHRLNIPHYMWSTEASRSRRRIGEEIKEAKRGQIGGKSIKAEAARLYAMKKQDVGNPNNTKKVVSTEEDVGPKEPESVKQNILENSTSDRNSKTAGGASGDDASTNSENIEGLETTGKVLSGEILDTAIKAMHESLDEVELALQKMDGIADASIDSNLAIEERSEEKENQTPSNSMYLSLESTPSSDLENTILSFSKDDNPSLFYTPQGNVVTLVNPTPITALCSNLLRLNLKE